jgi:sarcosine oxidase
MRKPSSLAAPWRSRGNPAQAVLEAVRPYLPNVERYRIVGTAMGCYADPPDKTFIVERQGRSVIVSECGGRMFIRAIVGGEIAAVHTGKATAATLDHWSKPLADL